MSYSTSKNSEQINYPFLLYTHMVCADQRIHNKELIHLETLKQQLRVGERTIEEKEKIFTQNENFLTIEIIAKGVASNQRSEVVWQLLHLAFIDGYCHPLERDMAEQVARIWNWEKTEIHQRIEQLEVRYSPAQATPNKTSILNSIAESFNSIFPGMQTKKQSQGASGSFSQQSELFKKNMILGGKDYDKAIVKCGAIADEDYKLTEAALEKTESTLDKLLKNIQSTTKKINENINKKNKVTTAKEVAKQLGDTRNSIKSEIIKDIKTVRESLYAKQHALRYFTIAFIGKTKAGKSTLHATLIGEGWNEIGKGKQRTTRFNRVYEFGNIRFIDTPGIGAPGGKTDEEITQSIVEESDIICYVVTNDSIQETEFRFLRLLKEKSKPLIILLNVQNNLRDSRRLEHFLKNPDKLFAMDGSSSLGGHIERIRRYAKEHYANDYFEIYPVMLLAAQFSRQSEYQQQQDKLFKASRIKNFLDAIRLSIVTHGVMHRSQTLLGSTVGTINKPCIWITQQTEIYQKWIDKLKNKRSTIQQQIARAKKDNSESLLQQITALFQETLNLVPEFSENNWNLTESDMRQNWKKELNKIEFELRLNDIFKNTSKKFNTDVQEAIQETGKELEIVAKLGGGIFFSTQDTDTILKDILTFVGIIMDVAASIARFFNPMLSFPMTIVSRVISLIANIFKSAETKHSEAVQNISNSLRTQLYEQKQRTLNDAKNSFDKSCDTVTENIHSYFEELIAQLEVFVTHLKTSEIELSKEANYLNHAYAKRIIDWYLDKNEPLTNENINKSIAKVERDFGRSIVIYTTFDLTTKKSEDIIKKVLQENVFIQSINSNK